MTASERMQARVAIAAARATAAAVRKSVDHARLGAKAGPQAQLARLLVETCFALEELASAVDALGSPHWRAKPLAGSRTVTQIRKVTR